MKGVNEPSCVNMSATSSLPTCPSLSLSKTWKTSLNSLTCAGNNFPIALLSVCVRFVNMPPNPGLFAPLVGDSGSLSGIFATSPLGVHVSFDAVSVVGVEARCSLEGVDTVAVDILVGEGVGVDCRRGEGDAGDSGLRKGDDRGDP